MNPALICFIWNFKKLREWSTVIRINGFIGTLGAIYKAVKINTADIDDP